MEKLLLIDDEEHILTAMAEYFTMLGYAVNCAADEASARALVDGQDFRVVITDLRLSRSDRFEGIEILDRIRSRSPRTACIVLTAYGNAENEAQAQRHGACMFLQKPTPLDELAAIVATLVNRCPEAACTDEQYSFPLVR